MIKKWVWLMLLLTLLYTRFVGLDWGLPYPMHPDERNMVVAIQSLHCSLPLNTECMNPHFFAYGQLPLYLAFIGIHIYHFVAQISGPISFVEGTIALRLISAVASILTVYVLKRIIDLAAPKKRVLFSVLSVIMFIFSPYAIQFSHFGTTESLLMLFYSSILYLTFLFVEKQEMRVLLSLALISGLAVATKISSLIFTVIPCGLLCAQFVSIIRSRHKTKRKQIVEKVRQIFLFFILAGLTALLFSLQSVISLKDFISSMNYESAVALGTYVAFYTRQFVGTTPVLFQFTHIFPYVFGWGQLILGIFGFFFLPWRAKKTKSAVETVYIDIIRIAFLLYFIPNAFFFAKWTRFMAPLFPLLSVMAVIFLARLPKKIWIPIVVVAVIPGIAYLAIYQHQDVRFQASNWIFKHVPSGSKVLSETANVVDVPIDDPLHPLETKPSYQYVSFNFYDVDVDPGLAARLSLLSKQADYIIVPSRRIFANHPSSTYPLLASYYDRLFSGEAGYTKVAEFSSFPRLQAGNMTLVQFPDETAEETWTVFDHPVIRIYKKNSDDSNQNPHLDFSHYETVMYRLLNNDYRLFVADTPEKQEKGLMYVASKNDIGGRDGMIFVFPDTQERTFWNKNTISDLDLYWIRDGEVAGLSKLPSINASRQTITTVTSPVPVNAVIEIIKTSSL